MKIALCTTTIHVPHALKLLRKCSDDIRFFVAIDEKTPEDVANFCTYDVSDTQIVYFDANKRWKCADAIGFNTLARRNLAFLEALKWGADIIYSWDNDNLPINTDHFNNIEDIFVEPFNGIKLGDAGWFDPGWLLSPRLRHRGFPRNELNHCSATTCVDVRIGVAAGLVTGEPDIDATTRMELHPLVGQAQLMAQSGVIVDTGSWTVFNSQNTAVIRELIPAWFMMPGVGRYDDIYASLIVQRVAYERDLHVHFGPPFAYQQRNEHNLIDDLRSEIDGMENVTKLAEILSDVVLPVTSVIDDVRVIYNELNFKQFIPVASIRAALAWCDDCEAIL